MAAQSEEENTSTLTIYDDEREYIELPSSAEEKRKNSGQESDLPPIEEREYLKGIKLALVLSALVIASFLMLLDMVIIATVRVINCCIIPFN